MENASFFNTVVLVRDMRLHPGAKQEDLDCLMDKLGIRFPSQYIEFMKFSNGAEGRIGQNGYFEIWPVEEIESANEETQVREFAPGLLLFGGDGANEVYAFDTRSEQMPILEVPLIGMDLKEG